METIVIQPTHCPACGKPLPAGALAGLCPACLLVQGADTDSGDRPARPRSEPPPPEDVAGLFPQLEILGLLGAGGMGTVYKARQPALDRIVALKILPAMGADGADLTERFNREARALARLTHPNIVTVYEFGQAGGRNFFIMEFVDGANLRQLERSGRLSPREALQIIPQICDALQYAHDEGVVHRDIKPENVLVDRKGRVKIADFGLAKILGQDAETLRLTREGQVMGTPHYMAPEQFERPLTVDHRADIYALGVVLYEMLTGDLPLGNFSPPSRKVEVDVRFDEVVLRALENDPDRRYQHASEVKSRVETIAGTPAPGIRTPPPAKPGERCLRWARFPVVIERDGKRRLNWRGVLPMFLVDFCVLSILFGLVTVFTGTSLWGWLGVKGWPSVMVRLVLAAVCVAFELRRVLRRPAGEEVCTGWSGLPISPQARWWLRGAKVGGFVVLCVGAWVWFQVTWLTPKLKELTGNVPAAQLAIPDGRTGALIATLPNGGSVELLALAEPGAPPNQWWRPDGSRFTNATFAVQGPADMTAPGQQKKELAFRVNGLPRDADSVLYDFDPAASVSVGGEVRQDGKAITGGWPMRVAWPASAVTATVRLGYLLDPWRTIALQNPGTYASSRTNRAGDPAWTAGFNHFSDDGTNAFLTVVLGPTTKRWQMRAIAVGQDGVEHLHQRAMGTPSESSTTWTLTFAGLTKAQVKEFQVQVRPVHWVEFRDVALRPAGVGTKPAVPTFGPVQELAFAELMDFDTGMTGSFPPSQSSNPFEGMGENLQWMQQHGFDALASLDKLEIVGVAVMDLAAAEWNAITPEALTRRLQVNGRFLDELRPRGETDPPATYGFRTREGGTGLLQFVLVNNRGATLRLKRVEMPAGEGP